MGISLLGGCANAGGFSQHGAVELRGPTVRAFAVGPAVVHAYAPTAGGRLFTTDAVGSPDAACAAALAQGRNAEPLPGDKVDELTLAAGKVACVAADTRGPYELVWHARAVEPATTQLVLAKQ
ncbi:MAG TPA: hypothetical protein VMT03_11380 [Polyangia bacterium]|nr:hypothetical protein [Polyangia bacterium]